MISTSPKRLRTTAWTINKNKKSQKAEGGKGRNFSASAFSNEGALICSGERTYPKRLRTTAWTINKNKKSQKAEGGKGRNFSASAFSNEGALICSGERTYGTEETGKNDKKTEAAPASPQNVSDGSSGGADLRRHLQRHPPCDKNGK